MLSRSSITECRCFCKFDYLIRDGSLEREAIGLELLREGTMMTFTVLHYMSRLLRPQWVSGSRPDVLRTLPLCTDVSHSILTNVQELLLWCMWTDCEIDYKAGGNVQINIWGPQVISHGPILNFPEVTITPAPLWWLSESKCK